MSDTEEENLDEKEGRTLEDPNNELKGGADVEMDEDTVSDQSKGDADVEQDEDEDVKFLEDLAAAIAENPDVAKCHVRYGGQNIDTLKKCARRLNIPTTQSKGSLVNAIQTKVMKRKELDQIEKEEEASRGTSFRKNKNTLPRLINFLMNYPDALQRSFCLASRTDLQNGQGPSHKRAIYEETMHSFNSPSNSGGIIKDREEYRKAGINPEERNTSGLITQNLIVMLWKDLLKAFRVPMEKFESSGRHNGHDFANYCYGDTNMLWLFDWLEKLGNVELTAFCAETSILPGGGVDTARDMFTSSPSPISEVDSSWDEDNDRERRPFNNDGAGRNIKSPVGRRICKEMSTSNSLKREINDVATAGWISITRRNEELLIAGLFDRLETMHAKYENLSDTDKESPRGLLIAGELKRLENEYNKNLK